MSYSFPKTGLSFKLVASIFLSISFIFIAIFIYNYNLTKAIVEKNIEDNSENLTQNKINKVEKVLISVEKVPENIARLLEKVSYSEKDLIEILNAMVDSNPEIYGATIAFEPFMFDKNLKYFAPYVYKSSGNLKSTSLGTDTYNYHNSPWYTKPKSLGYSVWSEPYFDEGGGNVIMSTFSVPIFKVINGERKIIGIITSDISLEWLDRIVSTIKVLESGYGFLISKEGRIITHPLTAKIMHETIFDLARTMKSPELEKIAYKMIQGRSGIAKISYSEITNGKISWVCYSPVQHSGWSLAVIYPEDELTSALDMLSTKVMALGFTGIIVLLIVIVIISKSITNPLTKLAKVTDHFAKGEMDIPLPEVKSSDEIGHLAKSFIYMRDELKKKMKELQQAYQELWDSKLRLEEYNKSLEEMVTERTKEVLVEAKELSELKTRFISMISHELRTPLYTISSSAEILELYNNRIKNEEKVEQFKRIQNAIDEILELLNDVISINKAEVGKINLKMEEFDIVEYSKNILEELSVRFEKIPELIFTSKQEKMIINSDKKELRQIISNLLINALKYTPIDKKVFYHISFDKNILIIEVKDEGIGITEEDKEHLFEVFERGKNVGGIHGTGLGLAITKRSVEILGGEIFFSSKEQVGSVFIIKIPIHPLAVEDTVNNNLINKFS